jgi:serine/threonine protein kinase
MNTKTIKLCRECGKPLETDALLGLCPECLMKAGLATPTKATIRLDPEALAEVSETETKEFVPGTRLGYFGDYELLEEIARGGMGVVYKARQTSLKRIVAVKMIRSGALADETEVARFRTEAQAAAQLQHPNIVAIHEIGEHAGRHYFSMDFVDGKNLAQIAAGRPVAPRKAAEWLKAMAGALQFAHQHGVLHRDLKPQNIMVDAEGLPRVTDFGLAKNIAGDSTLTQTGAVMGSPSYMSPEQARGRNDLVGPASDVYALGAILYEMLTGRPPFRGKSPLETLSEVVNDEPRPPRSWNPNAPVDLATICLKCLEKEPVRRYPTARELELDLGRYLAGEPVQARPASGLRKLAGWSRRRKWEFNVALSAVILALVSYVYGLWEQTRFLSWRVANPDSVKDISPRVNEFWLLVALEWLLFAVCFPVVKLGYLKVTTRAPWKRLISFESLREPMRRPASFGSAVAFGAAAAAGAGLALWLATIGISVGVWDSSGYFNVFLFVYPLIYSWLGMLLEIIRQQQRQPVGPDPDSAALTDEQLASVSAALAKGNVRRAAKHYQAATRAPFDEAQTQVLEMATKRLPAEQLGSIERAIFAGHIVGATKLFRAATHVPKRLAYLFVRRMQWKLHEAHPENFSDAQWLPAGQLASIHREIFAGHIVGAARLFRTATHVPNHLAYLFVRRMQRKLHAASPENFSDAKLAWIKANGTRFVVVWATAVLVVISWLLSSKSNSVLTIGPKLFCLVLGLGGGVVLRLVNWRVVYHITAGPIQVCIWFLLFPLVVFLLIGMLESAPLSSLALGVGLFTGWLAMHLRLRRHKIS